MCVHGLERETKSLNVCVYIKSKGKFSFQHQNISLLALIGLIVHSHSTHDFATTLCLQRGGTL